MTKVKEKKNGHSQNTQKNLNLSRDWLPEPQRTPWQLLLTAVQHELRLRQAAEPQKTPHCPVKPRHCDAS